jgi:1,4-dihydroxy-6-naphthoate synthase
VAGLRLGFSPCPNDTFVFHHLLEQHGDEYSVTIDDVEQLNAMAERGELDIAKVSVAAYGRIRADWSLLRSGGAAGFGVGPLLVAARQREPGGRIAIPGDRTTAALLLRLLGRFETVPMRFDRIEAAVLDGSVDAGVLIHEGRFTFADRGLVCLQDLGELWEARMGVPIPLGAIAIRSSLGADVAEETDRRIRASVEHARANPSSSAAFVRRHAQEMEPSVIRRHIDLYVNDYTLDLDDAAVQTLLDFGQAEELFS